MGFFSDLNKKRKKITKKLTPKWLRKTISKIGDFGMKVVGEIGKVVNKLGPIGMIAISVIAPYAAAAMVNMGGVMGAIGTAMQTVGSAISSVVQAPGKLLGQVAGKAVSATGEVISGALSDVGAEGLSQSMKTLTEKLTSGLGFDTGGGLSEGIKNVLGDVKTSIGDITTDSSSLFDVAVDKIADPKMVVPTQTENLVAPDLSHGLTSPPSPLLQPVGDKSLLAQVQEDMSTVVPEQMQNIDDTLRGQETQSLSGTANKLFEGAKSLLSPQQQVPQNPNLTMNPVPGANGAGRGAGANALRRSSFLGEEDTGVLAADRLQAMQQLAFNRGR